MQNRKQASTPSVDMITFFLEIKKRYNLIFEQPLQGSSVDSFLISLLICQNVAQSSVFEPNISNEKLAMALDRINEQLDPTQIDFSTKIKFLSFWLIAVRSIFKNLMNPDVTTKHDAAHWIKFQEIIEKVIQHLPQEAKSFKATAWTGENECHAYLLSLHLFLNSIRGFSTKSNDPDPSYLNLFQMKIIFSASRNNRSILDLYLIFLKTRYPEDQPVQTEDLGLLAESLSIFLSLQLVNPAFETFQHLNYILYRLVISGIVFQPKDAAKYEKLFNSAFEKFTPLEKNRWWLVLYMSGALDLAMKYVDSILMQADKAAIKQDDLYHVKLYCLIYTEKYQEAYKYYLQYSKNKDIESNNITKLILMIGMTKKNELNALVKKFIVNNLELLNLIKQLCSAVSKLDTLNDNEKVLAFAKIVFNNLADDDLFCQVIKRQKPEFLPKISLVITKILETGEIINSHTKSAEKPVEKMKLVHSDCDKKSSSSMPLIGKLENTKQQSKVANKVEVTIIKSQPKLIKKVSQPAKKSAKPSISLQEQKNSEETHYAKEIFQDLYAVAQKTPFIKKLGSTEYLSINLIVDQSKTVTTLLDTLEILVKCNGDITNIKKYGLAKPILELVKDFIEHASPAPLAKIIWSLAALNYSWDDLKKVGLDSIIIEAANKIELTIDNRHIGLAINLCWAQAAFGKDEKDYHFSFSKDLQAKLANMLALKSPPTISKFQEKVFKQVERLVIKRGETEVYNEFILHKILEIDIYLPGYKAVIEVDGTPHNTPAKKFTDNFKTRILKGLGYQIERINTHVSDDQMRHILENMGVLTDAIPYAINYINPVEDTKANEPPKDPKQIDSALNRSIRTMRR